MRRLTQHPHFITAVVLIQVHTIADALFTGGHPAPAVSAATVLALWAYFAGPRARETTDAHVR